MKGEFEFQELASHGMFRVKRQELLGLIDDRINHYGGFREWCKDFPHYDPGDLNRFVNGKANWSFKKLCMIAWDCGYYLTLEKR